MMNPAEPEPQACHNRDSSYGRLLRRLDQALDVARTRQWLAGQPNSLAELELNGLSSEDLRLLRRILDTLYARYPLPGVATMAPDSQQHQKSQH